jgi:hypothetical protein
MPDLFEQLNGMSGTVKEYDLNKNQFRVLLDDKPQSMWFAADRLRRL